MKDKYGGSYLSLTTRNNADFAVEWYEAEQLEAALEAYTQEIVMHPQQWPKDKLLNLKLQNGGVLRIMVSAILSICDNTEEQRESSWEWNKVIRQRHKEIDPEFD